MSGIDRDDSCCVLAAVGEGMVDKRGVAATLMGALAKANVNIKAIAQVCVRVWVWVCVGVSNGAELPPRVAPDSTALCVCRPLCVCNSITSSLTLLTAPVSPLSPPSPNPLSRAQGSSEYNITLLLDQVDSERALRAVHSRFYLSDVPIGVGIVGPGLIGATLLDQLKEQVGGGRKERRVCRRSCRVPVCSSQCV